MKFILKTTGNWYNDENKKRLEKYGFHFEKKTKYVHEGREWFKDDYGLNRNLIIEINTLEELLKIQEELGNLVIQKDCENKDVICIEIHDGHKE